MKRSCGVNTGGWSNDPLKTLTLALSDIKLAHSVFALPFAVLAAFLATPAEAPAGRVAGQLGLVVGCMFFARTWAMLVNRLADRGFDAANPRTARRVFAAGRLDARRGWAVAAGAAACFVVCCGGFLALFGNPWPLVLSLPTLAWIAFYSYTKRFTFLAHLFLGGALAFSPIAAAIAVHPASLGTTPTLWLLAGNVLFWVAAFDVAYALQDIDFDRSRGLHSIPARLGVTGALWVSRVFHVLAFGLLVAASLSDERFGPVFRGAAAAVGALLVWEHVVLARRGVAGLPLAFGTINGVVSILVGGAGVADLFL